MACRRFKQQVCGRLLWQLKTSLSPGEHQSQHAALIHSAHQQIQRHCRMSHTVCALNGRMYGSSHGAGTARSLHTTGAHQARFVSESEYRHDPVSPENILRNPLPDTHIPLDMSIHQMVFNMCDKYKDTLAVEDYLTGRSYTYSQLKEAIVRVGSALARRGYRKGDVLLAFAVNNVDFTVLTVACAATGVWFCPASPSFTPAELARQLHNCGAKGVCASEPLAGVVKDALANREFPNKVKDLFVFGEASGFEPFKSLLADDGKALPDVDIDPVNDVFLLPYSSGTTGLPKGVMLSHHNVVANVYQLSKLMNMEPSDRTLGLLPLYHVFGLVVIQFLTLVGGAMVSYLPKFDPEIMLRCMQERKITISLMVPPLILFLAKHPLVAKFDLTPLSEVLCGAAPLGEELTTAFMERLPNAKLRQGYGLTETSPALSVDMRIVKGSVGQPVPNTLCKVVDTASGKTLSAGELGEVWAQGPQVMLGYYNNQAATDDMITRDKWLRTGDLGCFDENGVIYIKDRLKELIKYKGSQVAPAELEALLLSHPEVQDVAVIGVPDEAAGELPKAFVVARPGSKLSTDQVLQFVEGKVAPTKKLRGGVEFVDEIPKTPSGKILRRLLRDKYL
ncbi:hypothetical protein EGW08_009963 [Elysia chlorotica]|uniref:4-coumarate--CoA ligase n=1 Tax=Elysia chlorotica TaxID=188477 RepID=A0A3S1HM80_ELYCH|nr:hypothetical protein EGW08_009963 [Elysia chlorotica]